MKARQRGVALITAVLIVAIVAAIATSLAFAQQVWLRQTQNLVDLARAEKLRQGALEIASVMLAEDAKNNQTNTTDTLKETWAQPIPPLPTDGATVTIRINDAQGLFNLNNLAPQTSAPGLPPGQLPVQAPGQPPGQPPGQGNDIPTYRQLLIALKIDPGLVETLIASLLDWLDNNNETRPGGAEDLEYLNRDPPYRAANRMLSSVDELLLINGYTPEIVDALRPYVIALPTNQAPINVNTAPIAVVAALTGLDLSAAEAVVRTRDASPFNNNEAFQSLFPQKKINGSFAVKTGYFIVSVEVRIGRVRRATEALIERPADGKNVKALWYRQPPFKIVLDEEKT